MSPPQTKSPGTAVPGALPGGTGGGSPLSGIRRDDNPGATHRPSHSPPVIVSNAKRE